MIDPAEIHVIQGPPGVHWFRRGNWTVEYRGRRFEVYSSPSHAVELTRQYEVVRADAARHIAAVAGVN